MQRRRGTSVAVATVEEKDDDAPTRDAYKACAKYAVAAALATLLVGHLVLAALLSDRLAGGGAERLRGAAHDALRSLHVLGQHI